MPVARMIIDRIASELDSPAEPAGCELGGQLVD
jgi:hypothetical protein